MPLPAFPNTDVVASGQGPGAYGTAITPAGDHRKTLISRYGTNVSNAVSYTVANVAAGDLITNTKWDDVKTKVNSEKTRRTGTGATLTLSNPINYTDFNNMRAALNNAGPATDQAYNTDGTITISTYPQIPAPSLPNAVASGTVIGYTQLSGIITALTTAATGTCTCDCNYCTCNCNYCTCNCNYTCTCNCNYSDERLKDNIKMIGNKEGLNIYSFTYKWNSEKLFTGVMAQELVGTKYASALGTDKAGYFYVDYSQLPITFEEV